MSRTIVLAILLGAFGCQCEAGSPDLIFDAGPGGSALPDCEGALINDPITGRCVPGRGVSKKCPDGAYDVEHPWAVEAIEAGSAVVYVAEGANGSGGESDPMGDLGAALEALRERGGLILLGDGSYTVGAQPLVTKPVTVVGRCADGSNVGGQVGGRWSVNGHGDDAVFRLSGARLHMGMKASNLRRIELNQVMMKAETGQRSQPGLEVRSDDDTGISLIASNVEISHWAQAVFATTGIAALRVTGAKMEQLGTGVIEVNSTVDNAEIEISNNLLTTREDADVIVAVGKAQGLGATIEERESLLDTFHGSVVIRDNTLRGLPDESINRQSEDGALNGVAILYPRENADNRVEVINNTISDLRDSGVWLRQEASSEEGTQTGNWLVQANTIERVARGMIIDHITGNLDVNENALIEPDGVGLALRHPGSGVTLRNNGVVSPGGRGFDLGPAKSASSTVAITANQVSGARRTGYYLRTAGGGTWNLNENTAHDSYWGFGVVGTDENDAPATVNFNGNGVTALDGEEHVVALGVVGVLGDVNIASDRIESAGVGIWLERNHGGTIRINNPAMIRSAGAALLATGNNSSLHIDELVLPRMDADSIAFDDLTANADAVVTVGTLLLDNRDVAVVNLSALVNPVDLAVVVDRSSLADEHYAGLDLTGGASMTADGFEGPDNAFRSGDMAGVAIGGSAGNRFQGLGDLTVPRGWLRGAP